MVPKLVPVMISDSVSIISNLSRNNAIASDHVTVKSRATLLKRKLNLRTSFLIGIILIVLILLVALIVVSVFYAKLRKAKSLCESVECLRAATNLALSIDETIDPCDDFYAFTCGKWSQEHILPNNNMGNDWMSELQDNVDKKVRDFLKQNNTKNDSLPIRQARDMYRACMNTALLNKLKYEPIYAFLESVGLPNIPYFFKAENPENDDYDFDFIKTIARIKQRLGIDLLFGFTVMSDFKNASIKYMHFDFLESENPFPRLTRKSSDKFFNENIRKSLKKDSEFEKVLREYFSKITRDLIKGVSNKTIEDLDGKISEAYDLSSNFTTELFDLVPKFNETDEDNFTTNFLSVQELQNHTDVYIALAGGFSEDIWEPYLLKLFNGSNVILNLNESDLLILFDDLELDYLGSVALLLSRTSKIRLELYIWLEIVELLIVHTTSEVRQWISVVYSSTIDNRGIDPRTVHCTSVVINLMGMAATYAIADKRFLKETKPKVENMFNDIRLGFEKIVTSSEWLDPLSKKATIEKSRLMRSFIGFPDWLFQSEKLEEYYEGVVIDIDRHLDNMINILQHESLGKLRSLRGHNAEKWASDPVEVNAYHTFQMNAITVPLAILQYPFYNLGLEVLNYGAIGSIIGHELTHGFDNNGRQFDKYGNLSPWWAKASIKEYVNRSKCFVQQYNQFYVAEVDDYIDGELTLGENIADNGGLADTIEAYKLYVKRHGVEPFLPGYEHYSHLQLLFIAFGNIWCEYAEPKALKSYLLDSHCPGKYRLLGVVANTPEFAEAFHCPKGSPMNSNRNRCRLW